ncbi:MAG: prephenate dehydratase [Elusimicrobia bacterium]|nr:prephenate dehydratase [Candidatus Liberimonas magnetica]
MQINKFRDKIDILDKKILNLLNKRAGLAKAIGRLKTKQNKEFYVPHREKMVISQILHKNKGPLTDFALEVIYREILNACRSLESKIKVAYFGPEATFTHQAALKNFGASVDYVAVKSIPDVFLEVEKNRADYGVVPVENSTEGMVNHTLDMFIESDLIICAELSMRIEECILSKSGRLKDVRLVVSNPQPLAQCRNWLEINLPGVPVREMLSTTQAAIFASKHKEVAAIASSAAAKIYNLEIIEKGIEDSKENYTRFLVISKHPAKKSGTDKTSVMFSIKDRVGALHDMLMSFKKNKVNLSKIESRPTKKKAWEYIFFIDMVGHIEEKRIQKALNEIEKNCMFLKVLGSYPRAD